MSMDSELSPTPKLSLFSLPDHTPDPEKLPTPPFHTPASVPFHWEEAPGKPRRCSAAAESSAKPRAARCLDLPPRRMMSSSPGEEIAKTPSPDSVLAGPADSSTAGSARTMSLSFRKASFRSPKLVVGKEITKTPSPDCVLTGPVDSSSTAGSVRTMSFSFRKAFRSPKLVEGKESDRVNFSSLRWGSEKGLFDEEEGEEGIYDFSSPFEGIIEEDATRVRKRGSFWANIYKSVKQAVPWRRKHDKRRKLV